VTPKTVVILGGGWGGLATAHHLRGLLSSEHRIIIVERNQSFSLCVSYLWLVTGDRDDLGQIRRDMHKLKHPGIEWLHAEALRFDPETRTVGTDVGEVIGDYVVIALGAELVPDAVPGFSVGAYNLYEAEGAVELRGALEAFEGGRIVVLVAGAPFRCPSAPYETAMLVEGLARKRGIRDQVELSLYTPEPRPMMVAGPDVSAALETMLGERQIRYQPQHTVTRIEPESRTLHFGDVGVPYDLIIGIPPHSAPKTVTDAHLVDDTGYVPVHPQTLEILADLDTLDTRYPNVFAIGDVTAIRLLNAMLLPKAGVFAEAQAQIVAAAIAADIQGEPAPDRYDGQGFCYVEVGDGMAAYGSGNFYAYPGPRVRLEAPTTDGRRAKEEFERLLDTWFDQ